MRGRACDDFQDPAVLQIPENRHKAAFPRIDKEVPASDEALEIKTGQFLELRLALGAVQLVFCQIDGAFDVSHVALLQQRIQQHGAEPSA